MAEIDLEFLLGAIPPAEAILYRVLLQLILAPSTEAPDMGGRQIEMAKLAKLTGFSKHWVIELMQRLEKKNFLRTDGGSGAVKWIWLLSPGAPRPGRPFPIELTQETETSTGKVKAAQVAAFQSKRSRKDTAPNPKPAAGVSVAPPVEKPAKLPARRRKGPRPPIPPADPASGSPAASTVIPPPSIPSPVGPTLLAAIVPPAPSAATGDPAGGNPRVWAAKIAPPPSTAPDGRPANIRVLRRAAKIAPPPAPGNPVVPAAMIPPVSSAAPGIPAAGSPVMPAAKAALPHPASAAPAVLAKRISPRKSTKKLLAGRSHWESAPIEELVAAPFTAS